MLSMKLGSAAFISAGRSNGGRWPVSATSNAPGVGNAFG